MTIKQKQIGLALSGGGQRAAAFHLGVLSALNKFGILAKIHTISGISGGSIITTCYTLAKGTFEEFYCGFKKTLKLNLEWRILFARNFIWKICLTLILILGLAYLYFSFHNYLFLILLIPLLIVIKYSLLIFPTGKSLQRVYDKNIFKGKSLNDLPDKPKIYINSTNLQTGTLLTFSKNEVYDSTYLFRYSYVPKFYIEKIPISFAVAASTSFAPLISPLSFDKNYIIDYENVILRKIKPELADGGIYDNQGIYRINKEEEIKIVICSDASSPYDRDKYTAINPFGLLMRTINILMKRIRAFQYVNTLFEIPHIFEVAYFSIDWQYETCLEKFAETALDKKIKSNVVEAHKLPKDFLDYANKEEKIIQEAKIINFMRDKIQFTSILANCLQPIDIIKISKISTRLRGLNDQEIETLINHGKTLTEIQLKLYCPSLEFNIN